MKLHEYYKNNKFNPTTFDILSEERLKLHSMKRDNLYVNKLCIPNMVWKNSRVLEVGCSSGENSLLYAQMGAKLTLIEPLADSIEKLKQLFTHYGMQDSVEKIFIDEIENVEIREKYNIVVAEGFINALKKKKDAVRKLFKSLAEESLLIISTNDTFGFFLECFKAAIAQLYCQKNSIEIFDEKIEAIRPFFEDDFNQIPHSRSFELWAKDVLINPIATTSPIYDFDEIVSDIKDLGPVYYSSWPSYKNTNDLVWHKKTVDNDTLLNQALNSYNLRKISFLFGEELAETEMIKFLLEHKNIDISMHVKKVITAIQEELHGGKLNCIYNAVSELKDIFNGKLKQLIMEMLSVLENLGPETYSRCLLIRKYWGVPLHYIVFKNGNDKRIK